MKIVFLDAGTVDLGDVNLSPLKKMGHYRGWAESSQNKLPRSCSDAEVVITNKVKLNRKNLESFKNLKLICVAATGVNNIELEAARELKIAVTNVAGYSTTTVVEHTLMFLLAFSHRLKEHQDAVQRGLWSRSPNFSLLNFPYSDLEGKTLGLLGYGTIGKKVAALAKALGMKVMVGKIPGRKYPASSGRFSLTKVFQQSDFVSLHCALSAATKGLVNQTTLKKMKPSAFLLNLARGPIVVESDLVQTLKANGIAGYATDVAAQEPLPSRHPFLQKSLAHKLWVTPHVAWASRESRQRLINEIAKNISAFKKGRRRNRLV